MDPKELARQLRKPEGETGITVARNMNEGNARMYELTYSEMKVENNDRVLEIGYGNGKFIPDLLNKADNLFYAGIDFSETMVTEAISLNKDILETGAAEILYGSISEIPYPNENFNKVFTINTLYFWQHPEKDLKEVHRVLQKGGKVYIGIRPKAIMEKIPVVQYGFKTYAFEEVKSLLENGGFTNVTNVVKDEPSFNFQGEEIPMKGMCISAEKK